MRVVSTGWSSATAAEGTIFVGRLVGKATWDVIVIEGFPLTFVVVVAPATKAVVVAEVEALDEGVLMIRALVGIQAFALSIQTSVVIYHSDGTGAYLLNDAEALVEVDGADSVELAAEDSPVEVGDGVDWEAETTLLTTDPTIWVALSEGVVVGRNRGDVATVSEDDPLTGNRVRSPVCPGNRGDSVAVAVGVSVETSAV